MSSEASDIAQVRAEGNATVVSVQGDVDMHRSPSLHTMLLDMIQRKPSLLVVDLAAVPYMDSSGVGTLVDCYRRVREYQGRMHLAGLQPRVRGVFEITKLDQFFTIRDSVAEALR